MPDEQQLAALSKVLRQHADSVYEATKPVVDFIETIEADAGHDFFRAKENAIYSLLEVSAKVHMLAHVLMEAHQRKR